VLAYQKPSVNREHPTQKPAGLVGQCLANSTASGDLVYDLFVGSCSALVAAETLGWRCHGMELDPKYCQVIIERWHGPTGRRAERVGGRTNRPRSVS